MINLIVENSKLSGRLHTPPSKSQTLRAILFGSLAQGESKIYRYLHSPDTHAMIEACRQFGADINAEGDELKIEGTNAHLKVPSNVIDAGNSGIVLRFITALAGLMQDYVVITGDASIRSNRPMQPLLDGLNQLGVFATSTRNNGFAPVIVRGPFQNDRALFEGKDSQPVSALLIASAFAGHDVELSVASPGEKPWIDMTLSWLDRFGLKYRNDNYQKYQVYGRNNKIAAFEYHVPGDMSSAAFPAVAALITGSEIKIQNIDFEDTQGDKEFFATLKSMGACIEIGTGNILIKDSLKNMHGGIFDINNYIDSIAIFAVLGCFVEGETHLTNATIARTKECNRIACIVQELRKMGADISESIDGLIIKKSSLRGCELCSHGDHRIAMALTIAAMGAKGSSKILGVDCIAKTYPNFVEDFQKLGARISLT